MLEGITSFRDRSGFGCVKFIPTDCNIFSLFSTRLARQFVMAMMLLLSKLRLAPTIRQEYTSIMKYTTGLPAALLRSRRDTTEMSSSQASISKTSPGPWMFDFAVPFSRRFWFWNLRFPYFDSIRSIWLVCWL